MINIALFASGTGSNVQALIEAQKSGRFQANLVALVCDNKQAAVIDKARQAKIQVLVLSPKDCASRQAWEATVIDFLQERQVDLIVLAGFMRIIGPDLLQAYPQRIMNIHPSLLPDFPGRNGIRDAFEAQVEETGVTVHWVDEGIDTGEIIAQAKLKIDPNWGLADLEAEIHKIEHRLYPEVIKEFIDQMKTKGAVQ